MRYHWYVYLAPIIVGAIAFVGGTLAALDPEGRGGKAFAAGLAVAVLALLTFVALIVRSFV